MANVAVRIPDGKGGSRDVSSTKWRGGTGNGRKHATGRAHHARTFQNGATCAVFVRVDRAQTAGRILLAEDDQVLARIYCRGLQAAGYVVDTVADGAEGFDRLLATRYDVVVSDLHMPRWTGLDLLQEVRRRRPDVPFVLITGRPDSLVQAEAPQTAMVRHLFKPVSMQELAHAVDSAVALRAARIRTKNGR